MAGIVHAVVFRRWSNISLIDNGISTQLIAHLTSVARSVVVPDLTPGVVYTLLACAFGGLTGQSDWSDPVSHMAM